MPEFPSATPGRGVAWCLARLFLVVAVAGLLFTACSGPASHELSVRVSGICTTQTSFKDAARLRVTVRGPGGSVLAAAPMKVRQTQATECSGVAPLGKVPEVHSYSIHVATIRGSVQVSLAKMQASDWNYHLGLGVQ